MTIGRLAYSILAGLIAALLTHVVLAAFALSPEPWALIVGILVFLGSYSAQRI